MERCIEQKGWGHSAAQDGARWGSAVRHGGCDRLGEHEEQGRDADHMDRNGSAGQSAEVARPHRLLGQDRREKGKASIIDLDIMLNSF
jgi:hypothetical protein